jgi:hypothetical protein
MNFVYAAFFEALVLLIPLPASILLNQALGPENRGYLAGLLLAPGVVASIVSCNWDKTLKGYLLRDSSALQDIFDKSYFLFIYQTMIGFLICFTLLFFNFKGFDIYFGLTITAILVVIPLQLASNYYISISSCIKNQFTIYFIKMGSTFAFLGSVSFFFFKDSISLSTAFLCNMMVATISLGASAYVLRNSIKFSLTPKSINIRRDDILSNFPSHVLEIISSQFDVWIILYFIGAAEAGAYLAFKMIELPFRSITFATLNFGAKKIVWDSSFDLIRSIFIITLIFSILLFLYFILSHFLNEIILFLLGESYRTFLWIITYIAVISALNNIYQILSTSFLYSGKIKLFYKLQLFNSFQKIIFIIFFYYFLNFKGVLLGLIFSNLSSVVLLFFIQLRLNFKPAHS